MTTASITLTHLCGFLFAFFLEHKGNSESLGNNDAQSSECQNHWQEKVRTHLCKIVYTVPNYTGEQFEKKIPLRSICMMIQSNIPKSQLFFFPCTLSFFFSPHLSLQISKIPPISSCKTCHLTTIGLIYSHVCGKLVCAVTMETVW